MHLRRSGIAASDRESEWEAFFSKSRACLRASPLVKQHGWGLHHDEHGRIAAYGVETDDYRRLAMMGDLKQVKGMRSRRA